MVRVFLYLREAIVGNRELAHKLEKLEQRLSRKLASHDQAIAGILKAIRELMTPPETPRRPIGFIHE